MELWTDISISKFWGSHSRLKHHQSGTLPVNTSLHIEYPPSVAVFNAQAFTCIILTEAKNNFERLLPCHYRIDFNIIGSTVICNIPLLTIILLLKCYKNFRGKGNIIKLWKFTVVICKSNIYGFFQINDLFCI